MLQHRTVANPGILKTLNNKPEVIIARPKNTQVSIQKWERENARDEGVGKNQKIDSGINISYVN